LRSTRSWLIAAAAALLLGAVSGCEEGADTDDGDAPSDVYLIEGYFGGNVVPGGFGLYVGRIDPGDPSASDCDVTLNGETVGLRGLLSDDDDALYAVLAYDYTPGTDYEIEVSLGGVSSSCSFTGPEYVWLTLDQPTDGPFTPGAPIDLVWSYDDGTPDTVHISVLGDDSEILLEEQLPGTNTSFTIPGSETAQWAGQTDMAIMVDLGGELWPFTGDLASMGSFVATIFTGDAAVMYAN